MDGIVISRFSHLPCPRQGDVVEDSSPRDTAEKAEGDAQDWEADNPVNVLGIEDLSSQLERRRRVHLVNENVAKVRSLGVVRDRADEKRNGEEIVEDLLARPRDEAGGEEGDERDNIDGGYCPQPIATVDR